MPYFMVFAAERRPIPGAYSQGRDSTPPVGLVWDNHPVGVFNAESAENACKAAARKEGRSGTFFAVEGFPWGLEMVPVEGVTELGAEFEQTEADKLTNRVRELEARLLDA